MSQPWKSPVAPLPPNPAPAPHTTSRRGALRPPIFNPYDKFTRPQFDSWIGDITSALRKALRKEEEPNKFKDDTSQVSDAPLRARETSEDEVSLSEGQNVGEGTEKSGEESDEALEDSFAHLQSRNSKGKVKDAREGRGLGNGNINQPIQILDESEEEEEVKEEHLDEGAHRDSSEDFSDSYEEEGEEHPENVASTKNIILLVSSDEGEDEEEGQEHNESDESEEVDAEQMLFNAQQQQDEDEDEEVESEIDDLPHAESDDQDDEAEEEFLPRSLSKFTEPEVELPDPWEGPRTYAEDFYAGGDLVAPAAAGLTPNNLTPLDMTPAESPREDLVVLPEAEEAFTITPGVLSRSPSPEIIEVDTKGLPKSSPPPALSDEEAENGDEEINDEHLDNEDLYGDLADTVHGSAQRENQDDRARALAFDWNWPPAFSGRIATRPGHLDSEGVQYEDAEDAHRDEDEDEDSFGALPLGTSDLDVPEKWAAGVDDGQNDDEKLGKIHDEGLDEVHEEQDEVRGIEPPMIILSSDEDEKEDDRIPEMHSMSGGEDSRHVTHHVPSESGFDPLSSGEFSVDSAYDTVVAGTEFASQTVALPGQPRAEEGLGDIFDSSFIIPASGANTVHESDVSDEQIEAFFASLQRQTVGEPDNSFVVQDVFSSTDLKEIVGDSSSNIVDIEIAAEGQLKSSDETLNATTGNPSIEVSNMAEESFGADTAYGIVEEIDPALEADALAQSSDEGTLSAAQSSAPDKVSVSTAEREMSIYVVEELTPEPEARSPGTEDGLPDVRSAAPSEAGAPDFNLTDYLVEEVRTGGRVTAEPEAATDTTVPSVGQLDDASDAHLGKGGSSASSLTVDLETTLAQDNNVSPIQPMIAHARTLPTSPPRSSFPPFIPAPVSADPNVPDPASRPHSPPPPSPSSSAAKVQVATSFATAASVLRAQDLEDPGLSGSPREGPSGLFTPVPGSLGGGTPTPSDSSIDASEAPRRDAESVTPKATSNLSLAPVIVADYIAQEDTVLGTEPSDQDQSHDSSVDGATDNTAQNGGPLLALFQQYVGRNLTFVPTTVTAGENVVLGTELKNSRTAVSEPDAEQDAVSESTVPHVPLEGSPDVDEEVATLSPPDEEQASAAASVVDTKAKTASSAEDDLGQLQLSYPEGSVSSDEHVGVSASASVDNLPDASEDLDGDTDGDGDLDADADGELDPDYFSDAEQDPFLVRSSHRPIHVNGSELPLEKTHIEPSKIELPSTPIEVRQPDEGNSSERTADRTPERPSSDTEIASSSQVQTENADSGDDEQSSVPSPTESKPASRMLKRKRALPSRSISPRRTRSQTANVTKKQPKGKRAVKNLDKGKGKAKAEEQVVPVEEENPMNDDVSDHGSTSSGASAASQMLIAPGMRSRSQSSVSATSSAILPPIPSGRPHIQLVLPPLIHTHSHGFIHHHHGRAPPLPPAVAKPASSTQPKALAKSRSTSAEFSSQPSPSQLRSPSRRAPPTMSSPVTRSNCRFHRISVPSQEGGSRSYFIVPGCSLGDRELMKDEEIEDRGFATQDDHARMIADIESLNLNSYLVGILRQLVGVDLLREQEVFYLPNAGESVHKRTKRRKSAVDELKRRQSTASASYRIPGSPISRSTTPMPTSLQDSASAGMSSGPQKGSKLGGGSTLSGDESELTDYDEQVEEAPKAKRRKLSPAESSASASSAAMPSASAPLPSRSVSIAEDDATASASQPIAIRKSKRRPLHVDAIAYKPEREDAEESGEDVQNSKAKRKKDRPSRVAKRRRTDEISASAPRDKRSRARKSTSVGD